MRKRFYNDWGPNIAQILIVVIIVPGIFALMGLFGAKEEARDVMLRYLGNLPGADVIIDSVSITNGLKTLDGTDLFWEMLVFESLVVALCMEIFETLQKILKVRGMPIISGLLGVALATLVVEGHRDIPVWAVLFLGVLLVVINIIWGSDEKLSIRALLLECVFFVARLALKIIALAFLVGYAAVLYIVWKNGVAEMWPTVLASLGLVIPWAVLMSFDMYLFTKE